jgi:glycosyltransferase involved in cell wall biosynthesis
MLLASALFLFLLLAILASELVRSEKYMISLRDRRYEERDWPSISIVVAARNEQESIEVAILSLLQQSYPRYELIVVNDRSTDRTGSILSELQKLHSELKIITLQELPSGWLGKCNAMQQGAMRATGDWLLFTDADVSMKSNTLKVAIDYALSEKADHLALAPRCELPSWILEAFVATFVFFFKLFVNPSKIHNPRSKSHVGIGAFNLIRRDVYLQIGGHEPIRLRPDDDLKLGKLIKQQGFRQRFANGLGLISVPWYRSMKELMHGLEKNSFASIDYSLAKFLASNVVFLLLFVVPFSLPFFARGLGLWVSLANCCLIFFLGVYNAVKSGYRFHHGLFFPLGVVLFLFIFDRAVFLTVWRGGIVWRNCFYSLDELKNNVI